MSYVIQQLMLVYLFLFRIASNTQEENNTIFPFLILVYVDRRNIILAIVSQCNIMFNLLLVQVNDNE